MPCPCKLSHEVPRLAASPLAPELPLAPAHVAVDRCQRLRSRGYCSPTATARVTIITRRDYRSNRSCRKLLQNSEVLWKIGDSVWPDVESALGTRLYRWGAEEAPRTVLTEGMAAAKHAGTSIC